MPFEFLQIQQEFQQIQNIEPLSLPKQVEEREAAPQETVPKFVLE